MVNVTLPYDWEPWQHQRDLMGYMQNGGKRAVCCWHRRGGKDITVLNWTIMATQMRPGIYWHMLPTFKQGRKVVWNGITNDGRKFLDYIPPELIKRKLDQEMMIEFTNGSIWQVVGSDDIDRLVGSNPVGVVYSEFSLTNPAAWDMVRPILNANGGWSIGRATSRKCRPI